MKKNLHPNLHSLFNTFTEASFQEHRLVFGAGETPEPDSTEAAAPAVEETPNQKTAREAAEAAALAAAETETAERAETEADHKKTEEAETAGDPIVSAVEASADALAIATAEPTPTPPEEGTVEDPETGTSSPLPLTTLFTSFDEQKVKDLAGKTILIPFGPGEPIACKIQSEGIRFINQTTTIEFTTEKGTMTLTKKGSTYEMSLATTDSEPQIMTYNAKGELTKFTIGTKEFKIDKDGKLDSGNGTENFADNIMGKGKDAFGHFDNFVAQFRELIELFIVYVAKTPEDNEDGRVKTIMYFSLRSGIGLKNKQLLSTVTAEALLNADKGEDDLVGTLAALNGLGFDVTDPKGTAIIEMIGHFRKAQDNPAADFEGNKDLPIQEAVLAMGMIDRKGGYKTPREKKVQRLAVNDRFENTLNDEAPTLDEADLGELADYLTKHDLDFGDDKKFRFKSKESALKLMSTKLGDLDNLAINESVANSFGLKLENYQIFLANISQMPQETPTGSTRFAEIAPTRLSRTVGDILHYVNDVKFKQEPVAEKKADESESAADGTATAETETPAATSETEKKDEAPEEESEKDDDKKEEDAA